LIWAVLLEEGRYHGDRVDLSLDQLLVTDRALDVLEGGVDPANGPLVELGGDDHRIGSDEAEPGGEEPRGRGVDHDVVVVGGDFLESVVHQEPAGRALVDVPGDVGKLELAGKDVDTVDTDRSGGVNDRAFLVKDCTQGMLELLVREEVARRRVLRVRVDEEHPAAAGGEHIREADRGGALTDAALDGSNRKQRAYQSSSRSAGGEHRSCDSDALPHIRSPEILLKDPIDHVAETDTLDATEEVYVPDMFLRQGHRFRRSHRASSRKI
jgi:hypothetical protein